MSIFTIFFFTFNTLIFFILFIFFFESSFSFLIYILWDSLPWNTFLVLNLGMEFLYDKWSFCRKVCLWRSKRDFKSLFIVVDLSSVSCYSPSKGRSIVSLKLATWIFMKISSCALGIHLPSMGLLSANSQCQSVVSWNPQRTEIIWSLWTACFTAGLPSWVKKVFLIPNLNLSFSS